MRCLWSLTSFIVYIRNKLVIYLYAIPYTILLMPLILIVTFVYLPELIQMTLKQCLISFNVRVLCVYRCQRQMHLWIGALKFNYTITTTLNYKTEFYWGVLLYFHWLVYPAYCCLRFHWRRVDNKPVYRCFSVKMVSLILPKTHLCLVATWYERNSAFQHLDVRVAFFWLFITHVHYINDETHDFLGAQKNHMCCKLIQLPKQSIVPLNVVDT